MGKKKAQAPLHAIQGLKAAIAAGVFDDDDGGARAGRHLLKGHFP